MCSPNIRCLACSPTSNHITVTQHWVIERSAAITCVYQTGSWPEDMVKIRCLHLHQEYGGERVVFPQLRKLRSLAGGLCDGKGVLVPTPTTPALLIRYSRDNANHTPKRHCVCIVVTWWSWQHGTAFFTLIPWEAKCLKLSFLFRFFLFKCFPPLHSFSSLVVTFLPQIVHPVPSCQIIIFPFHFPLLSSTHSLRPSSLPVAPFHFQALHKCAHMQKHTCKSSFYMWEKMRHLSSSG